VQLGVQHVNSAAGASKHANSNLDFECANAMTQMMIKVEVFLESPLVLASTPTGAVGAAGAGGGSGGFESGEESHSEMFRKTLH
jgi:hypothetical protein